MPVPPFPVPGGLFADEAAARPCAPTRGPRRRPVTTLAVDEDLTWVLPLPSVAAGSARRSSPSALVHLQVQLVREYAEATGDEPEAALADAELIDAAARAVAGYLDDLPDLPLVGEPFGGEEGTD